MKAKLTKSLIDRTQPGDKDVVIRDTEVPGLFLKITPTGAKSLLVRLRLGSGSGAPIRQPKIPVDPSAPGAVEKARKIAREWRSQGADGVDPRQARKEEARAPTMARLCEEYMKRHGSSKRSASEDERRIGKLPRSLMRRRVKDISHTEIQDLHRAMKKTPYEANRMVALLSKMFGLAIKWRWITENPVTGIDKFEEEKRERFLSQDEIVRLDAALTEYADERNDIEGRDAADAIRLLLLTGARSSELLSATWDQFDFKRGVWTKPSSHTKTKKVHRVALSALVVDLLNGIRARRELPGRWVFPGRSGGHRKSLKKAWDDLRVRANIADVRIHDLRHSAASLMLSAGVPLDIVGRVLGHTQAQTTLRYAHLTDEAGKAATDALGKVIAFKKWTV